MPAFPAVLAKATSRALLVTDAAHATGRGTPVPRASQRKVPSETRRLARIACLGDSRRHGAAPARRTRTCYLVDPASSHMLVSKIKPCMSKYKQVCTVKLRMAH